MKLRIRILCTCPGQPNTMADSPMWSWAVRELDAQVWYYGNRPERLDEVVDGCDVAVYSAVMGGPCMPSLEAFKRAKAKCRLVCLTCDASDWREVSPLMETWRDNDVFDAVVNIDGNPDWPQRPGKDFTWCGLFDPKPYDKVLPRVRRLGYNGAGGDPRAHKRPGILKALAGLLDPIIVGDYALVAGKYQQYADYMLGCRAVVNTAWNGSGKRMHVKGRCNEAALAGCLLFETKGSPLNLYFDPKVDYCEYESPEQIKDYLNWSTFDETAELIGQRFREKMARLYGPERFWQQVLAA